MTFGVPATAAMLLVLATLAGCSSDGDPEPAGFEAELKVTLKSPGATDSVVTLDCPGGGGTGESATCERLQRSLDAGEVDLQEWPSGTPPDQACAEIFGGEEELEVSGTIAGEPVDITRDRSNSCQIDQFDRWVEVLGDGDGLEGLSG